MNETKHLLNIMDILDKKDTTLRFESNQKHELMAEGPHNSKSSARKRKLEENGSSISGSSISTGTSGLIARRDSGNVPQNKKKKANSKDGDDDLGWVRPTSRHQMTVVDVHKKNLNRLGYADLKDWLKKPDHVYIGRNMTVYVPGAVGSKWRNPFVSKKLGRTECCIRYTDYVKSDRKLHDGGKTLRQSLDELKGKTLGCWCHPKRCHGHMLVELVNELC